MQLGIFAKTFAGSAPREVFAAAAQAGFATVQYNMACSGLDALPHSIPLELARDVAIAAREHNIAINAVSGTFNMIHPDAAVRKDGLARLEVLASRCLAMNTAMITLCTGTRDLDDQWRFHPDNATPDAWRDLLASMAAALEIADRWNVDLGIEPELANVVNSAGKARLLLDELKSPHLKIVLDPANLFETTSLQGQRAIVAAAIDTLGGRIAMAHAKDRAADGSFATAGKGVLDFGHYLSCLKASGFSGPLITHGLRADEASGVAKFLQNALSQATARSA
jgi:sugar phosphate isomerase/epimerase